MNHGIRTIIGLALAAAVAGCGQEAETPVADPAASAGNSQAEIVATPVQEKHASGTGKVVTVDEVKGKVRIAHLPLPDANWPGMTTTFDAKPELLSGIAPGQTVSFDVTFRGGSGEVTAIRR